MARTRLFELPTRQIKEDQHLMIPEELACFVLSNEGWILVQG
jgi:hypothetical protein